MLPEFDCYRRLKVSSDADENAIRKAWRTCTKSVHPDVNASATAGAEFMQLTQAMELLLDPVLRLQHDIKWGYGNVVRNQDRNSKQHFSEEQLQRAQELVKKWSNDYEAAMHIRSRQRMNHIAAHKKRMRRYVMVALIAVAALLIALLVMLFR
jgi:DnaJ-class molecular chaperone